MESLVMIQFDYFKIYFVIYFESMWFDLHLIWDSMIVVDSAWAWHNLSAVWKQCNADTDVYHRVYDCIICGLTT